MFDFVKAIFIILAIWVVFLSVPIAGALVGTALALAILYFFIKVLSEDVTDE